MAWLTCSISAQYCQTQMSTCLSKADANLELDNQFSNLVVAEDAVHIVGSGTHMLFPSSGQAKLTSCNHFISITYFVLRISDYKLNISQMSYQVEPKSSPSFSIWWLFGGANSNISFSHPHCVASPELLCKLHKESCSFHEKQNLIHFLDECL